MTFQVKNIFLVANSYSQLFSTDWTNHGQRSGEQKINKGSSKITSSVAYSKVAVNVAKSQMCIHQELPSVTITSSPHFIFPQIHQNLPDFPSSWSPSVTSHSTTMQQGSVRSGKETHPSLSAVLFIAGHRGLQSTTPLLHEHTDLHPSFQASPGLNVSFLCVQNSADFGSAKEGKIM